MENGLIFPYPCECAMEGRRRIDQPAVGCRCKQVGLERRQIHAPLRPRRESVAVRPEVIDSPLPRKAPKFSSRGPYRKPTQVGGCKCTKALERTLVKELGKITP